MMARIFGFISIHNISLRQWKLNYFEISEERLSYSLVKASDTTFKKKKKKKTYKTMVPKIFYVNIFQIFPAVQDLFLPLNK
jgi:hypothetical protein